MKKIKEDIDVLSIAQKEKLLKEINQESLIDLFRSSCKTTVYKPVEAKKTTLDQQLVISISTEEKDYIKSELLSIRKVSEKASVSSYIRNKSLTLIDIVKWKECALEGLRKLTSKEYDEKFLLIEKRKYLKMLDNTVDVTTDDDELNKENRYIYTNKLHDIDSKLNELKKHSPKRNYRLSGRTTFNESNLIRWRAARLSLTVADYVRFVIFEYEPNTFADLHLSVNARKRFYISILDIAKNGWGSPPIVNECPNCARYIADIKELKEQLARYKILEQARR